MLQRKLGKNRIVTLSGYTPPYRVNVYRKNTTGKVSATGVTLTFIKSELLSKQFSDFSKAAQYIHILRQFAYGRSVKPVFDIPLFSRISTLQPNQHAYINQKPTLAKFRSI